MVGCRDLLKTQKQSGQIDLIWQKSDGETTRQFRNINSELWLAALNGRFNLPEALGQVVRRASYMQCELCTCHWCSVFYYVLLLLFSLYWMFLTLVSHSESLGDQSVDKIIKAASLIHCKVRAILALGKKKTADRKTEWARSTKAQSRGRNGENSHWECNNAGQSEGSFCKFYNSLSLKSKTSAEHHVIYPYSRNSTFNVPIHNFLIIPEF